jgi:hypothetical protein
MLNLRQQRGLGLCLVCHVCHNLSSRAGLVLTFELKHQLNDAVMQDLQPRDKKLVKLIS